MASVLSFSASAAFVLQTIDNKPLPVSVWHSKAEQQLKASSALLSVARKWMIVVLFNEQFSSNLSEKVRFCLKIRVTAN